MKVAIDSGALKSGHKIRGIGAYTDQLIKAMGSKVDSVNFSESNLSKYDVVHFTSFNPFFKSFKLVPGTKVVVTIHDVIPLLYPEHYPPGFKGKVRLAAQKVLLRGVDAIIADTETSKKDIVRFLGVNPKKVYVTHLASKEIFRREVSKSVIAEIKKKYNLPDKFVLYVGDVNYNKNIPSLIKACMMADAPLVICGKQALEVEDLGEDLRNLKGPRDWIRYLFGKPHPETQHYKDILKVLEESKNVKRLGFVSDHDLAAIYKLATVYVQPSYYEGFGLPVLEAMASGTPVICAKTQALVEIAGDGALIVDTDAESISRGIKRVLTNPEFRNKLKTLGIKRSNEFSWQKTAEATLNVYGKLAS